MRAGVCSSMTSSAICAMSASQSGGGIGVDGVTFSLVERLECEMSRDG
jgi:hypothetical protein